MTNIPPISISVVPNARPKNERSPVSTVFITVNEDVTLRDGTFLPAGLKLEGGLWNATAKSGTQYMRGSINDPYIPPTGNDQQRRGTYKTQTRDSRLSRDARSFQEYANKDSKESLDF